MHFSNFLTLEIILVCRNYFARRNKMFRCFNHCFLFIYNILMHLQIFLFFIKKEATIFMALKSQNELDD